MTAPWEIDGGTKEEPCSRGESEKKADSVFGIVRWIEVGVAILVFLAIMLVFLVRKGIQFFF